MEWEEGPLKKAGCGATRGSAPHMFLLSPPPRAPSPLCKAPASNMSAATLLWPLVRPGPWYPKTSPASVLSLSGIDRTSPRRVGTGMLGNLTAVSSLGASEGIKNLGEWQLSRVLGARWQVGWSARS